MHPSKSLLKESVPPTFRRATQLSPSATMKQLGVSSVVEILDENESVCVTWAAASLKRGLIPEDGRGRYSCPESQTRKQHAGGSWKIKFIHEILKKKIAAYCEFEK